MERSTGEEFCASCGFGRQSDPLRAPCARCGAATLLDGTYQLVEVLASGSIGTVYLARHISDGSLAAAKRLRAEGLDSIKGFELFKREAETLSQLNHPGIPRCLGTHTAGEHTYIVLEYIEGRSLAQELQHRRFTEREVLEVLERIALVLKYLHGLSPPVVHRDLKPSNIILRPDRSIALVDFGSVAFESAAGSGELRSTITGTVGYMAPEQFRGQSDPASDIYSLGVIGLELLTRKPPSELMDLANHVVVPKELGITSATRRLLGNLLRSEARRRPVIAELLRDLDPRAKPRRSAVRRLGPSVVAAAIVAGGAVFASVRSGGPASYLKRAMSLGRPAGVPPPLEQLPCTSALSLKLPEATNLVVPAGRGHYLLLRFPRQRRVGVYDARRHEIVGNIPAPDPGVLVAGGADRVVLLSPLTRTLDVWSLPDLAHRASRPLGFDGVPLGLAMGWNSVGPLLVRYSAATRPTDPSQYIVLDATSLVVSRASHLLDKAQPRLARDDVRLRISAGGTRGVIWGLLGSELWAFGSPPKLLKTQPTISSAFFWPQDDGPILSAGGRFSPALEPIPGKDTLKETLDLTSLPFALGLKEGFADNSPDLNLVVGEIDAQYPEFSLGVLKGYDAWNHAADLQGFRISLMLADGVVVAIHPDGSELSSLRFDFLEKLRERGMRYSFVSSVPPNEATPGATYTYEMTLESSGAAARLGLRSGPPGMSLEGTTLRWSVPASWTGPTTVVVEAVISPKAREHSWTIWPRKAP